VSTVREVCRRALMRGRIYGPGEEPSSDDMADAVAQLNDMMFAWKQMGVDVGHAELDADDAFVFFVPPLAADADTISALAFQGAWDANANSPALAGSTGTEGYVYRVSTAGSTTLDDVTSWSVDDFALFDGQVWLKGRSSRPFDGAVIAMLAVQLCSDHGKDPLPVIVREAAMGWRHISACYIKPKMNDNIDLALVHMSSRQLMPDGTLLEG
jgi:hypothetical protein